MGASFFTYLKSKGKWKMRGGGVDKTNSLDENNIVRTSKGTSRVKINGWLILLILLLKLAKLKGSFTLIWIFLNGNFHWLCVFVCEKSVKGIKGMKPNTKPRSMNDWSNYKVHKKTSTKYLLMCSFPSLTPPTVAQRQRIL